jgi:hypothetical protein
VSRTNPRLYRLLDPAFEHGSLFFGSTHVPGA